MLHHQKKKNTTKRVFIETKNALDYFYKTTCLFCLCECLREPKGTCFVFPQTRVLGPFRKNSEEAQQSSPPTFMLGCGRELNTERPEGRAGCSEECRGLAKLTAQSAAPRRKDRSFSTASVHQPAGRSFTPASSRGLESNWQTVRLLLLLSFLVIYKGVQEVTWNVEILQPEKRILPPLANIPCEPAAQNGIWTKETTTCWKNENPTSINLDYKGTQMLIWKQNVLNVGTDFL